MTSSRSGRPQRRRSRTATIALGVVCVLLLAAVLVMVGDSGDGPTAREEDDGEATAPTVTLPFEPEPGTVYALDNAYGPIDVVATVGDTVRFENVDDVAHTFTDDGGRFDSEVIEPGARYGFAYASPGLYTFHCEIHPTMRSTVEIVPTDT